jgi:hypothetical protein
MRPIYRARLLCMVQLLVGPCEINGPLIPLIPALGQVPGTGIITPAPLTRQLGVMLITAAFWGV